MVEEQALKRMALAHRKSNPRSQADFATLYNELEEWRRAEVAKIKVRKTFLI
jgi:hypothetical protein